MPTPPPVHDDADAIAALRSPRTAGCGHERCGLCPGHLRCCECRGSHHSGSARVPAPASALEVIEVPRSIEDRRQVQRRPEDQRLHLARELVIEKARHVAHTYGSPLGLDIAALEALVELVAVLETAEQGVKDR